MCMKKAIFLFLLGYCCITLDLRAQSYKESGFLLGINAGYTYPLGDFGKINKNGLGGGIAAKYLINRVVGIGLEAGYHTFKSEIPALGTDNSQQDYKCRLIPLVLEGTFYIPTWDRTLLPYLGVHFGAYFTHIKVARTPSYPSETDPPVSKNLFLFSPGVGLHAGLLIEISEFLKLDCKIKGDYVMEIDDKYTIHGSEKSIGFDQITDLGVSIGLLYSF